MVKQTRRGHGRQRGLMGLVSFAALLLLTGCGGGGENAGDDNAAAKADPNATPKLIVVDADKLPIGDYLPPLDGGRVELADPEGWRRFPRNKQYVARFYLKSSKGLPRVIVSADDSPYEGISDVTDANYEALFKAVEAEVESKESLLETPLPLKIGQRHYVRYVLAAQLGLDGAERQVLVTVLGGRRYTVDLQIAKRTIKEFRDCGYAVAASLKPAANAPTAPLGEPAPAKPQS